ncbi:MAG: hypothetical protein KIT10_13280 [Flavobacteriales bacterium]|nr:hypothetical protein [Flavobacteriales bacterium]
MWIHPRHELMSICMMLLCVGTALHAQDRTEARPRYDIWINGTGFGKLTPVRLLDVRAEGLLVAPANRNSAVRMPDLLVPPDELGSVMARRRNAKLTGAAVGGASGLLLGMGVGYLTGRDRTHDLGFFRVTYKDQNTLLFALIGTCVGFSIGLGAGSQRHAHYVNGNATIYEGLRPKLREYLPRRSTGP